MSVDARRPGWASVLTATLTTFGLVVSSGVAAVVVAGTLQWSSSISPTLDNVIPLVVLAAGLLLAGRVSVDVAGSRGVLSTVGSAVLVGLVGWSLSRTSEAHGDGIEVSQVLQATAVVLLLTAGAAAATVWRRSRAG